MAEELALLLGHHVDVVQEAFLVVNLREFGHGGGLGARCLAVGDRTAAIENEYVGKPARPVIDQREGQREAHQEEGGHGNTVVRAPLLRRLGDGIRNGELERFGVAADKQIRQAEFALALVFEPAVGAVAVRAAVNGMLGVAIEIVVAIERLVALECRRVVAIFVVLADDFLETAGCRGELLSVAQGRVDA